MSNSHPTYPEKPGSQTGYGSQGGYPERQGSQGGYPERQGSQTSAQPQGYPPAPASQGSQRSQMPSSYPSRYQQPQQQMQSSQQGYPPQQAGQQGYPQRQGSMSGSQRQGSPTAHGMENKPPVAPNGVPYRQEGQPQGSPYKQESPYKQDGQMQGSHFRQQPGHVQQWPQPQDQQGYPGAQPYPNEEVVDWANASPFEDENDLKKRKKNKSSDPWNQNKERYTWYQIVLVMVAVQLSLGALICVFFAYKWDKDGFRRTDNYHPNAASLNNRHWTDYNPFLQDKGFLLGGQPVSCIQTTNFKEQYPTDWACEYNIPYTATMAAICTGFTGLAVICVHHVLIRYRPKGTDNMARSADTIRRKFLEYIKKMLPYILVITGVVWILIYIIVDYRDNPQEMPSGAMSFFVGVLIALLNALLNGLAAYEGSSRAAAACYSSDEKGVRRGLKIIHRAAGCMGIGVLATVCATIPSIYNIFGNVVSLAGFALGGSVVTVFMRIGGSVYAKAGEIGTDISEKREVAFSQYPSKNPGMLTYIAGQNLSSVIGVGCDLFDSAAGALVSAAVLGASEFGDDGVALPFYLLMLSVGVNTFCSLYVRGLKGKNNTQPSVFKLNRNLRVNMWVANILYACIALLLCLGLFNDIGNTLDDRPGSSDDQDYPGPRLWGCVMLGTTAGIISELITEHFSSYFEHPTQSIAKASEYGTSLVILQGIGMGMYCTTVPTLALIGAMSGANYLAGFYGISIAALGLLTSSSIASTTSGLYSISHNAKMIAVISNLPGYVKENAETLESLGIAATSTAASMSHGSAAFTSIAMVCAFTRVAAIDDIQVVKPVVLLGIFLGALAPFAVSSLTMMSVVKTVKRVVNEVQAQVRKNPDMLIVNGQTRPNYRKLAKLVQSAAVKSVIYPILIVFFVPAAVGFGLGSHALVGFLVSCIACGYLLGMFMSIFGIAVKSAKKYIESGRLVINRQLHDTTSASHTSLCTAEVVGSPLKDAAGPSLNILSKCMAYVSFILAPRFADDMEFWDRGVIVVSCLILLAILLEFTVLKEKKPKDYDEEDTEEDEAPPGDNVLVDED